MGDLHVYHFPVPNISENCKLTISSRNSHAKVSSPVSLKSSKLKWENVLPLMGEGSPVLSSGSFSDLIKAVLSTKSSNFLYKSGNNKALLDKKSLTTNSKTG